jgi:hypothetical protein
LFERLGIEKDFVGTAKVGKGVVVRMKESPARLAHHKDGADQVREACRKAAGDVGVKWEEAGGLVLRRGPYVVAGGIGGKSKLAGKYVDLFAEGLPVVTDPEITEGARRLLVDLAKVGTESKVIAAGGKVTEEHAEGKKLSLKVEGVEGTRGAVKLALPGKPTRALVDGKETAATWEDGLAGVSFDSHASGVTIEVEW